MVHFICWNRAAPCSTAASAAGCRAAGCLPTSRQPECKPARAPVQLYSDHGARYPVGMRRGDGPVSGEFPGDGAHEFQVHRGWQQLGAAWRGVQSACAGQPIEIVVRWRCRKPGTLAFCPTPNKFGKKLFCQFSEQTFSNSRGKLFRLAWKDKERRRQ